LWEHTRFSCYTIKYERCSLDINFVFRGKTFFYNNITIFSSKKKLLENPIKIDYFLIENRIKWVNFNLIKVPPLKKSQFLQKRRFRDKSMIGWIQVRAFINNIIFWMAHGFYDSFLKSLSLSSNKKSRAKNDLLYPLYLCSVDFVAKNSRRTFILYI
jgi:hypothetical protein